MSNYAGIGKTDWFIEKMRSGWFSKLELVNLAAIEFPDVPRKKLEGTIGQYWTDCVNPKWSTYKAVQARGLKVLESNGRRHIVSNSDCGSSVGYVNPSPPNMPAVSSVQKPLHMAKRRSGAQTVQRSIPLSSAVSDLWNSKEEVRWQEALERYWTFCQSCEPTT